MTCREVSYQPLPWLVGLGLGRRLTTVTESPQKAGSLAPRNPFPLPEHRQLIRGPAGEILFAAIRPDHLNVIDPLGRSQPNRGEEKRGKATDNCLTPPFAGSKRVNWCHRQCENPTLKCWERT